MPKEVYCRQHDFYDCWLHPHQVPIMAEIAMMVQYWVEQCTVPNHVTKWDGKGELHVRVLQREENEAEQRVLFDTRPMLCVNLRNADGGVIGYSVTPLVDSFTK